MNPSCPSEACKHVALFTCVVAIDKPKLELTPR